MSLQAVALSSECQPSPDSGGPADCTGTRFQEMGTVFKGLGKRNGLLGVFLLLRTNRGVAAEFHAREGFHPEKLWDLLFTAGLVVLGLAVVIGFLWALRWWQERHNQWREDRR